MKWGPLGECRDCHGPVAWGRLPTGRAMPLHPGPLPGGNVAVMRDAADRLVARVLTSTGPPAQRYEQTTVHHAAVCPPRQAERAAAAAMHQLTLDDDQEPDR